MLSLLQKSLKSCKVFIYIIFKSQSKRVFKKSRIRGSKRQIMQFGTKFFESPTGPRHPREMKTSTAVIKTSGHQGTLQFF